MRKSLLFFASATTLFFLTLFLVSSRQEREGFDNFPSFRIRSSLTPTPSPWVTYTNSRYGYSLSYPRGWQKKDWDIQEAAKIKKPQEGMIWQQVKFEGRERNFQVILWVNRQRVTVPQWLRWYRHEDLDSKNIPSKFNYQILGKEAYLMLSEKTSWGYPVVRIFFSHEDHIFEFVIQSPSENLDQIYQEMVESFKLLESE